MNIGEAQAVQLVLRHLFLLDDRPAPTDDQVLEAVQTLADRASKAMGAGPTALTVASSAWRTT